MKLQTQAELAHPVPDPAPMFWVEAIPTAAPADAPPGSGPMAVHLRVSGDLDVASSASMEAAALAAIETGAPVVVVDLSGVVFVDSYGMRSLIEASRAAERDGIHLMVTGMSGGVDRLLRLTGLSTRLGRGHDRRNDISHN